MDSQNQPQKEEEKQQTQQVENQTSEEDQQQQKQQKKVQKYLRPDFIYCPNNSSLDSLIQTYPHLQTLKDANKVDYETVQEAQSYVIRSNNDDDIHKAIKYGVWCSTPPNNEMLDKAYKKAQEDGQEIYLFYSVVKSGQFVGVAKLKSALKEETFAYWWQHTKWRGHFLIEWLFVKDIVYKQFDSLKNKKGDPVIRSKDGTEIDWKETGLPMIQIFQKGHNEQSIFTDFEHMDQREQFQRYVRSQNTQQTQQGNGAQAQNGVASQQQQYYSQQYQQQYQQQQYYNQQYQYYYSQYPQYAMNNQYMKQNNAFPPTSYQQKNQYNNYNNKNNYNQNQGYKKNYNGQKKYYNNNNNTNGGQGYYNKYNNQNKNNSTKSQLQQPEQQ